MSEAAVHVASGKVRELYALDDDRLLLVASDRISTFDVVLPTEIPDKGRVLTGLSGFWFARTERIVPNHLLALRDDGRSTECRRLEMLPIECVVRGYLAGSGWKDYRATGAVCGHRLPEGLVESRASCRSRSSRPATKAQTGHDENIDRDDGRRRSSASRSLRRGRARSRSSSTASRPSTRAARGIILADTKLEFGLDADGRLVLADEAFTPDSSRFWPADEYAPGGPQPSFDKQFVRDYCESLGWDKTDPGPELPDDVVDGTRARYVEAFERLTEIGFDDYLADPERGARDEGDRARPAEAGHPRPAGPGGRELAPAPRLRRSARRRSAGSSSSSSTTDDPDEARDAARADVRAAAREPADRELRDRARQANERRRERPPAIAVVVFPGLERRPRRAARARAPRRRRAARLAHRARAPAGNGSGRPPRRVLVRRLPPLRGDRPLLAGHAARSSRFAADGGLVLGICNGFQILTEAGLLPGALRPNESLSFVCRDVHAPRRACATRRSPSRCAPAQQLTIPVKHGEGCWFADAELARRARGERARSLLRYAPGENPNGVGRRRRRRRQRRAATSSG